MRNTRIGYAGCTSSHAPSHIKDKTGEGPTPGRISLSPALDAISEATRSRVNNTPDCGTSVSLKGELLVE